MRNDWVITTVGEYADVLTGFPFKSKQYTDNPEDIRLLRGDNIAQRYLRWEQAKHWSKDELDQYDKFKLECGDIVLAMDRPWIAAGLKIARLQKKDLPALLVQRVARLRGSVKLDTRFLYYILSSEKFTNYVLNVQTGTGVPHISTGQIKDYKFVMPPIHVQKAISEILGDLDDKIELNLRINETLEQQAMTLYKHWFEDFGPFQDGEFEESELGMIPKGWEARSLYSLASFVNGMAFKQQHLNDSKIGLPIIKISELNKGNINDAKYYDGQYVEKYELNTGDVLFSWSASLGIYLWAQGKALLNQHIFNVKPNGSYYKGTLYFLLQKIIKEFQDIAAARATTMGHIKKEHLESKFIAYPPNDVRERIEPVLEELFNLILSNLKENEHLKRTRDYLLPRLLSGEIELGEAEKRVEEVL